MFLVVLVGHPKTRPMINHGGLNSVYEAIYHGVPMVSVPLFGDQFDLFVRIEPRGFAKQVDITTMTGETLLKACVDVLNNRRWVTSWSKD